LSSKIEKKGKAMILPKGEVRHQNLLTAYTDLSALLSALKSESFSGILEIEFPEKKGAIFIDSGEIINAEIKEKGKAETTIGPDAIQAFLTFSNQKDGVLNVYRFLPEQVALIANHLKHEVLFKELSTDFTRLDRLLLKLKEDKHNGFIEVLTKEKKILGVLFVEGGDAVDMFTTPESEPSVFGRKSIPIFVENAVKQGAIFNVYRSQSKVFEKHILEKHIKEEIKEETKEKIKEEIKEGKVTPRGEELKELIPIFQDILSKSEKLVDETSKRRGLFHKVFKESLIDKSEEFAFLDPFVGEFEFKDGTIHFSGEAGGKEFTKGILECLNTTLLLLEKELPKNKMVSLKLIAGIKFSLEQHTEALKRLGVDAVAFSVFK
jgi:hypothetical protein